MESVSLTSMPKIRPSVPGGCSNVKAVFSVLMTAIGLGVMTLPMAFAKAGWIGGIVLLLLSSGLACYNNELLAKSLFLNPSDKLQPIGSVEELGHICYGKVAQWMNFLTVHPFLMCARAVFLILLARCMNDMTGVLTYELWIIIIAVLIAPFACLPTMKDIAFMSALGVAAVTCVLIVIVAGSLDTYISDPVEPEHTLISSSPMDLISVFCTFLLSFTVSFTVPTIVKDMKYPKDFPKVGRVAFFIIATVYILICVAGYMVFGNDILNYDTIVEVFSPSDKAWSVYGWLLNIVTVVMVTCNFIVFSQPTGQLADSLLRSNDTERWSSPLLAEFCRCACRCALVALCAIIAIFVPSVDLLVNLLSAVFIVLLALVYPTIYYWRMLQLNGLKQSNVAFYFQTFLLVLAAVAIVCGSYSAILAFF